MKLLNYKINALSCLKLLLAFGAAFAVFVLLLFTATAANADNDTPSASPEAAVNYQKIILKPLFSDGISWTNEADLTEYSVMGSIKDNTVTFSETKQLKITFSVSDGYSFCERYSYFFKNQEPNVIFSQKRNNFTFIYTAIRGGSLPVSFIQKIWFFASASELPKVCLDINMNFADVNKDNWVGAEINIFEGTSDFGRNSYSAICSIKGRGNSSWTYAKKPYSINLSKKTSLLGIPETKRYALVASYYDGTFIRNYITFRACEKLNNIPYTPKGELVEVYLNGKYNGIYMLTERVKVEQTKIDLDLATEAEMSGDYLIEKDLSSKANTKTDIWFAAPFQANAAKDIFVIKEPESSNKKFNDAMVSYLSDYMQKVNDAIMGTSGESYTKYIDVGSWVDYLIIQEVTKNIDGNLKTSCYMYKKKNDDKLYMTALWDFDFAYGKVSWSNACVYNEQEDCPPANTTDGFIIANSSCPWFLALYHRPEFAELVKKTYSEYRYTLLADIFKDINEQAAYLSQRADAAAAVWHVNYLNTGVRNLTEWLTKRFEWLDNQWLLPGYTDIVKLAVFGTGDSTYFGSFECSNLSMNVSVGSSVTLKLPQKEDYIVSKIYFNGCDISEYINREKNSITTPVLHSDSVLETVFLKSGDINCDNEINMGDAILLLRSLELLSNTESLSQFTLDYNDDGKYNQSDVQLMLKNHFIDYNYDMADILLMTKYCQADSALSELQKACADINADKEINTADVTELLKLSVDREQ